MSSKNTPSLPQSFTKRHARLIERDKERQWPLEMFQRKLAAQDEELHLFHVKTDQGRLKRESIGEWLCALTQKDIVNLPFLVGPFPSFGHPQTAALLSEHETNTDTANGITGRMREYFLGSI